MQLQTILVSLPFSEEDHSKSISGNFQRTPPYSQSILLTLPGNKRVPSEDNYKYHDLHQAESWFSGSRQQAHPFAKRPSSWFGCAFSICLPNPTQVKPGHHFCHHNQKYFKLAPDHKEMIYGYYINGYNTPQNVKPESDSTWP